MTKNKGLSPTYPAILHTCTYITDDRYIASYHGVSLERVKQVRDKMGKRVQPNRGAKNIPGLNKGPSSKSIANNTPLGTTSEERLFRANAKEGSADLLKALLAFFNNREKQLRIAARAELGL